MGLKNGGGSGEAGGTVIYAVGDVHGRSDLLAELHRRIAADAEARGAGRRVLVHLGDYVDRGPDSKGVIALVMAGIEGFETVSLRGNHEQMMIDWIETADLRAGEQWLANGGDATAASLMGEAFAGFADPRKLKAALGPAGLKWLLELPLCHREGDFFFVHAGVRPGLPLDAQDEEAMLWIRTRFLRDERDHGARIVHGHTPTKTSLPEVKRNRIAVDTGAVFSGRLTAAILDPANPEADPDFLYAEGSTDPDWKPEWL